MKAGSEYEGTLKLSGFVAAEEAPLIIGVYGENEENKYAKIVGPADSSCVEISDSNVRVSGLETTGSTAYRGIWLNPKKAGAMKNVVISGNYCHDLNFNVSDLENGLNSLPEVGTAPDTAMLESICPTERYVYKNGGIIAEAATSKEVGASWFENVWIENNVIERVSRTGIWVFSNWTYRPGSTWGNNLYVSDDVEYYPHKNVVIRNNTLSHVGGDSIVMGAVRGGWIERNTSYFAQYLGRLGCYNVGIWTHSCKNVVFQYNEAAYTYKQNGAGDGHGFDIDIGNSDIVFQNNYSHHNEGGGILLCNTMTWTKLYDTSGNLIQERYVLADWQNVILRNNVFADNWKEVFDINGTIKNLTVENNTVVIPGSSDSDLILTSADNQCNNKKGSNWVFRNNIFISRKGKNADFDTSFSSEYLFDCNVFWGFPETFATDMKVTHGNSMQELIVANPGINVDTEAQKGLTSMFAYKPGNENMLKGADALAQKNRYDAEGVDVQGKQYFGAFSTLSRK